MEEYFDDNLITPVTQSVLNVVSPIASAISVINPKLASIPIIISITNEISNYFDNKYINQRLNLLLETCQKQNIEIEKLKEIIAAMDEHSTYVLRNHIKGLCIQALPETATLYANTIIQYLKNDSSNMNEEICEIVSDFNAFDIELLQKIKEFLQYGDLVEYNKAIEKQKSEQLQSDFDNQNVQDDSSSSSLRSESISVKFHDRNIIYENNTIFWKDFCNYYNLHANDMGVMLNYPGMEGKRKVYDWAFLMRSILKMQNLGVIQVEFYSSLGSISMNYINRFHITLFGQELLKLV